MRATELASDDEPRALPRFAAQFASALGWRLAYNGSVHATSQGATASNRVAVGERKRWWALISLMREALSASRWARFSRWSTVALTLLYAVRLLGDDGSTKALTRGLEALFWPVLVALPALFSVSPERRRALEQLGHLHGLTLRASAGALGVARALLLGVPQMASSVVLWGCFALGLEGFRQAFLALAGALATLLVQGGVAGCLAALASVSEQFSPERAQRVTWLLVLIPAALYAVVPELPSVWHAYEHWVGRAVLLGTSP